MDRQAARQLRVTRGVVASALTVLLAAVAHTTGGGPAPSPLLLALSIVLAAPAATLLVGRRPQILRTAAAVTAAQLVFHGVFGLFATPAAVTVAPGSAVPGMPGTAGMAGMHAGMTMALTAGGHAAAVAMPLAHVVAALATLVLAHQGERMLRGIRRGILRLLRTAVVPAVPAPAHRRLLPPFSAPRTRPRGIVVGAASRRGPPALPA